MTMLGKKFEEGLEQKRDPLLMDLLLKHYIHNKTDFICIATLAGGEIVYVNQAFLDYVGYEREELFGQDFTILQIWETPAEREAFIQSLKKSKYIHNMEQRFRDKYGRILTYVISSEILTIYGEECILTTGRDISTHSGLEDYRLHQSEDELRQTLQSLNSLFIKLRKREDGQLYYVLAEGQIAYEVGYTTANSYGKTVEELFPGLMEIEGEYYERALGGEVVSFEVQLGDRMLYKTLTPYRERDQIVGIIGSAIDISERKKLERLLQVSSINSALGQLAAGAAHEIRNPLTSIKGFVQLIGELCSRNRLDKGLEYVELILSELSRINQLVSEMLWLRKPKEVISELFSLKKLLEEIIPLVEVEAHLKSITVLMQPASGDILLAGNSSQLKQVILNLCKNGIEAMHDGGALTIAVDPANDAVTIAIQDTGPGIPQAIRDKLFDPFFTTKPNGNGLGLFIAQQIVTEMGGRLDLESSPEGTRVIIVMPVQVGSIEGQASDAESSRLSPGEERGE